MLAGVLNICFALGCVPLYFTIERVGRRSVLLYGAMTLTLLMTIFMTLQLVDQTPAISWAAIGIIFVFIAVFGYSWQGSVWLYCSEISPLEYRHIGGAFTASVSLKFNSKLHHANMVQQGEWLMTWLTVFVGPIGLESVGSRFWAWVLSGNVVAVIFVYVKYDRFLRLTMSNPLAGTSCVQRLEAKHSRRLTPYSTQVLLLVSRKPRTSRKLMTSRKPGRWRKTTTSFRR